MIYIKISTILFTYKNVLTNIIFFIFHKALMVDKSILSKFVEI